MNDDNYAKLYEFILMFNLPLYTMQVARPFPLYAPSKLMAVSKRRQTWMA